MNLLTTRLRASALAVLLLAVGGGAGADPIAIPARDGQHDFDFFVGTWKQHNRRLKDPLTGSGTWYEFDSRTVVRPVWGGKANMDEFEADSPTGRIQGLTLRLYDANARQWVGAFDASGHGEFFDHETIQGRWVLVRYLWSDIKADSYRWEQAFSLDGGKTWETNWVTDGTRGR